MTSDKFDVSVCWEPFLLRSGIPMEGVEKPPNAPGTPRVNPRLKEAGLKVGIDFTGKTDRYPNTLACHALLEYTRTTAGLGKQNDVAEALFQAYFTDGIYPDANALTDIAEKCGLDKMSVKTAITDQANIDAACKKAMEWSRKGVSGVPYFFMNGQETFSGAQDPDTFIKTFHDIAEKFPKAKSNQDAVL